MDFASVLDREYVHFFRHFLAKLSWRGKDVSLSKQSHIMTGGHPA
jgi:hypothetical protein